MGLRHAQDMLGIFRPLNGEAFDAASGGDHGKIDGLKLHTVFGVPLQNHLLPLDLSEHIVLMTMTHTCSLYFTSVADSLMSTVRPPSPTTQTTCRPGYATDAPIEYGRPLLMVASEPDNETSGDADVRDTMAPVRGAHGHVDHIDRMRRADHPLVGDRHVHKQLVEIDVLLLMHADEIGEGVTRDGEDRLQIRIWHS